MRHLRRFEEYVQEGIARKATPDTERAASLLLESDRKMSSLLERLDRLGVRDENANDYVEYCYDLLMLLVRARLYVDGYSTGGHGSHEAEISYMRIAGVSEPDVQRMDQMRYFRNGILYYGSMLDAEFATQVIEFTIRLYPLLRKAALPQS